MGDKSKEGVANTLKPAKNKYKKKINGDLMLVRKPLKKRRISGLKKVEYITFCFITIQLYLTHCSIRCINIIHGAEKI
jgi:hypothetical protein